MTGGERGRLRSTKTRTNHFHAADLPSSSRSTPLTVLGFLPLLSLIELYDTISSNVVGGSPSIGAYVITTSVERRRRQFWSSNPKHEVSHSLCLFFHNGSVLATTCHDPCKAL